MHVYSRKLWIDVEAAVLKSDKLSKENDGEQIIETLPAMSKSPPDEADENE